jgi:hypothetical protein
LRRRWAVATALERVPFHGGKWSFGLDGAGGRRRSALTQSFSRRCSRIRGACSCISRERFPEHALGFLWRRLGLFQCAVVARWVGRADHGAGVAIPWLVVFTQELDEIRGEQADHAPVALQPAHPPGAIAGVDDLDQVAFYKSEIAFCLQVHDG